jgi:glycosyltransferase involved in cell wall biosynthesis
VKLAVYLPALNEAGTIGELLDAIPRRIPGITALDTIVIDDGSTDGTAGMAFLHGARVIRHPRNLGTGRAFMSGVRAALSGGADIIVGMDADGQFAPRDIAALIAPIVSGTADVALCTRFGPHSTQTGRMPGAKRLWNRLLCKIISFTAEQEFSDVSCGFRAFTRDAALRVDIHSDFEYIHESLLTWHRFGQRVVEVELPVRAERVIGESRVLSSIPYYSLRAAPVLLGAIRDYSPLLFFGSLALIALVPSVLIGAGVLVDWWRTGGAVAHTSLIVVSVGGVLMAVILGSVALLADHLARMKYQVEEMVHTARIHDDDIPDRHRNRFDLPETKVTRRPRVN